MATVESCVDNSGLGGQEKFKIKGFLSSILNTTITPYTGRRHAIDTTITQVRGDHTIAKSLWNWVSNNFSSKPNGCPALADVLYVITLLKAAKGEVDNLTKFYSKESFDGLGKLLGSAGIKHKDGIPIETAAAILKLQLGGRRMKHKSRRMHRSKNNKTYRRKYNKRFT